jgi:hypothetical protein
MSKHRAILMPVDKGVGRICFSFKNIEELGVGFSEVFVFNGE